MFTLQKVGEIRKTKWKDRFLEVNYCDHREIMVYNVSCYV